MKRTLSILIILIFMFSTSRAQAYFRLQEVDKKNHYSLLLDRDLKIVSNFEGFTRKTNKHKEVKNKYKVSLLGKNQGLEIKYFKNLTIINTLIIGKDLRDSLERIQLENFFISQEVRRPSFYADLIIEKLDTWHERKIFASILVPETHGKSNQTSTMGAKGPWQIMPEWGRMFKVKNLQDPEQNLDTAIKVLNIHIADGNGKLWGHKGGIWHYNHSMKYVKMVQNLYNKIDAKTYFHHPVS
ncbi:MAG: transglycosylase SLT domain-containing protein [Candidatus Gracilibacteria bacterium]|nr:transglycosylase SLT domain-containing protein [Candidatus Gracilibacteria bacterium]MDD2908875.1 transglycosylase SLT domain-containing protein [Candidatus Gracilibacteria bacterium]